MTDRELQETFSTQEFAGNVLVTLDDLNLRMDAYSSQLLDQARWQSEWVAQDLASAYGLDRTMPLAEETAQSVTNAIGILERLEPAMDETFTLATTAPELVSQEREAALKAVHEEISRTMEFAQQERKTAFKELNDALIAERKVLVTSAEGMSQKVVDHAIWRLAQLAGAVLLVVFFGLIILLLMVRRLFAAPTLNT